MIRYRCPHCAALIVAHERRAGQSSVCKACVKPHTIPADSSLWLNEAGDPLHPPAPPPPAPVPVPEPVAEDLVVLTATAPNIPLPEPAPEPLASVPRPTPSAEPEPVAPPVALASSTPPSSPRPAPRVARWTPTVPSFGERPAAPPETTVATETPPPAPPQPRSRPFAVPVPTPAPRVARSFPPPAVRESAPPVARGEPVQLQTQADIAVALTAALTSRMKPPAAPRRDLRPSTAAWMLLTGTGAVFATLAVFSDPSYRWAAIAAGAIQVLAGYAWIVHLTHLRDPKRGLMCAVPPLTLIYLAQFKYAKLRPLRFVATGAALAGIAAAAPSLHTGARQLVGKPEPAPTAVTDVSERSKLEQLRTYRERQAYDPLMKTLEVLAKTDPLLSEDAKNRAELTAELKGLCQHIDVAVRVRAMAAYARWDPDAARGVCLAAVGSPTYEEREWALRLLPLWKDVDTARAVQTLIGRAGTETNQAKAALEEIGGPPAEQAAITLFNRADDQGAKLTALTILEKVGGPEAVTWLRQNAKVIDDPAVRARALSAADVIEVRTRSTRP